jgi:hypothetical protein
MEHVLSSTLAAEEEEFMKERADNVLINTKHDNDDALTGMVMAMDTSPSAQALEPPETKSSTPIPMETGESRTALLDNFSYCRLFPRKQLHPIRSIRVSERNIPQTIIVHLGALGDRLKREYGSGSMPTKDYEKTERNTRKMYGVPKKSSSGRQGHQVSEDDEAVAARPRKKYKKGGFCGHAVSLAWDVLQNCLTDQIP